MNRTFWVSANVAPSHQKPPREKVTGSFAFGAFNAAREYAKTRLPTYEVIPGGVQLGITEYRFEAIDQEAQLGAVLFVEEIL